ITYYEVITQLALMPDKPMEPASPADLQIALQHVINQRILENQAVGEAEAFEWVPDNRGIQKKLQELTSYFRTPAEFEKRLKVAGFASINDENLRSAITRRLFIEWYLDVHFRRCLRPPPEIEQRYYNEIFAPEFRRRHPGILLPTVDEKRAEINRIISEKGSAEEIEKYLTRAKRRVSIEIFLK
ncbi:MAG: hypothetical protein ABIU09_00150, partial [Pyrinomonadaceae bacterium]